LQWVEAKLEVLFQQQVTKREKELSAQIREIFYEYTDLVEPLSLDEAYLDVTKNKKGNPSANSIAREIRQKIFDNTGLRASAGISINKFIAKVASDINKPNGQKTVHPDEVISFLEALPVNKFYGVGKVTAAKMYNLGIFTGNDLKKKTQEELVTLFGKSGISSEIFMLARLEQIAEELERRMVKHNIKGKTITLKIKYSDFTQQTRSKTKAHFMQSKSAFFPVVKELFFQDELINSVRLLGISFGNLNTEKTAPIWVQLKFEF